jgi:diketogulonate reductase-like aldo/keto reductase
VWSFQRGKVWANKPTRVCVAQTLPQFLSRMYVENLAWLLLHSPRCYEEQCADDSPMRGIVWRYVEHMRRHHPHARKHDPFAAILGQ